MPQPVSLIMTMSFCVSVFKNVFVMVSLNVGALVSRISVTVVFRYERKNVYLQA